MKSIISLVLAGVLASSLVCADNFTEANVTKANAVIDAAIEAHGPGGKLADLRTLIVEFDRVVYSFGQSRGTEPPWDKSESEGVSAIDLEQSVFATHGTNAGGGFETHNGTIIGSEKSYQLDYRAGTVAEIAEPDFDTTSGPFVRVNPPLLIKVLDERRANAYYLGEVSVDGEDYEVVGFSMTVGPAISLYFDKQTHLLHRSERIFPGIGLVEYEFLDYEMIKGIAVNRIFNLFVEGDANVEQINAVVRVNEPLADLLKVDARLESVPEIPPDPLSRQEITDGVWLIGGNGTYAMFVDMGEYIFAAGGTAGLPERIDSLREVVGDKPLRYGMLTHHHFDHVVGVSTYEAEGTVLIAAAAHEKVVRDAAVNGEALELKTVKDRMTLEGERQTVEIIDIGPTAHTEHLLVAYLPEEGILFEADHFAMPQQGPIPPAVSSTRTFAEALGREELNVKQILSTHSPRPGTMQDLRAALAKEVFQASR